MSNNGNGEAKQPETPEERSIRRRKLWEENPDDFIHVSELVIGTRVLSSGQIQCIVGMPNQLLLEMSCTRINYEVHKILLHLEMEARKREIVAPPKGGIINFARRR